MGMIYKTAAVVVAWLRAPYILEDDEHQIGSLGNGLADMASSKLSAEEKAAVNLEAESYLRQGIFEIQDLLQQPDKGIKERAFDPRLRDLSFVQSHTEECLRLVTPLLKNWLVFLNLLERRYFGRKWVSSYTLVPLHNQRAFVPSNILPSDSKNTCRNLVQHRILLARLGCASDIRIGSPRNRHEDRGRSYTIHDWRHSDPMGRFWKSILRVGRTEKYEPRGSQHIKSLSQPKTRQRCWGRIAAFNFVRDMRRTWQISEPHHDRSQSLRRDPPFTHQPLRRLDADRAERAPRRRLRPGPVLPSNAVVFTRLIRISSSRARATRSSKLMTHPERQECSQDSKPAWNSSPGSGERRGTRKRMRCSSTCSTRHGTVSSFSTCPPLRKKRRRGCLGPRLVGSGWRRGCGRTG